MNNHRRVIIDLSTQWGKLSAEHVGRWQRDYSGYALDPLIMIAKSGLKISCQTLWI
jgi:hypothetical protein